MGNYFLTKQLKHTMVKEKAFSINGGGKIGKPHAKE